MHRVFELYSTVSAYDTLGIKSYGIGLPTVKKIIENAGGEISIQSVPGISTTFFFSIKKPA